MKRRQKFIKFKDLNAWDDIEEMQSASRHTATWERLPTPVFWPGEFHGLYSPWGRKESDTTEATQQQQQQAWWLGGKESAGNAGAAGDLGSIPESGRSPGEGNGHPLKNTCL